MSKKEIISKIESAFRTHNNLGDAGDTSELKKEIIEIIEKYFEDKTFVYDEGFHLKDHFRTDRKQRDDYDKGFGPKGY